MERQTSNLSSPAEFATTATANVPNATPYDVTTDVFGIRTLFVNVFFVGAPGKGNPWTLIDAGVLRVCQPGPGTCRTTIWGGGMSLMSWIFPIGPTDFSEVLTEIPASMRITELPD